MRSTLRAAAIDAGDQNATEFGAGLVSGGAAVGVVVAVSIPTAQRRLRPQGRERRRRLDGAAVIDPLSAIAPDFTSSLSFSTPEVATPTRRLSLLRQRRKPRSAAASRAVRRRRALERANGPRSATLSFCKGRSSCPWCLPPILAFALWPMIADAMAIFFNGQNAAQPVDGNLFAVQLLRPTVNGVVLPTLSVALGTLLATTINVLRNRQVDIRAALNKEACELRLLRAALLGAYGTAQHAGRRAEALDLVRAYSARIVAESSPGAFEAIRREERAGGVGVNELEPLGRMLHGVDGAFAARQGSVQACLQLLNELNSHRSERLAALLGGFPPIHWFVLSQLAISILLAFLIESNQEVLQFLNSLQLRVLFALIVAVCSGTATLCLDLTDPFRGRFSVVTATAQIVRLEDLAGRRRGCGRTAGRRRPDAGRAGCGVFSYADVGLRGAGPRGRRRRVLCRAAHLAPEAAAHGRLLNLFLVSLLFDRCVDGVAGPARGPAHHYPVTASSERRSYGGRGLGGLEAVPVPQGPPGLGTPPASPERSRRARRDKQRRSGSGRAIFFR